MPVLPAGELVYLLPEIVLAATAMILLLADAFAGGRDEATTAAGAAPGAAAAGPAAEGRRDWIGYLAVLGVVVAMILIRRDVTQPGPILGGMVASDGYAAFFKAVFLIATALVALMSIDYVAQRGIAAGEYFSLLLLATTGALFMAGAANLLTFYLGLELLSLSSYALAGLMRTDPRSQEASLKYFLNGALSSGVLLFGISLLYGATGTFDLVELARQVGQALQGGEPAGPLPAPVLALGVAFLLAGLAFKAGAVPFHLWLPDAYQGAPTPITAYLAVASEGAAFAAILRVFYGGLGGAQATWQEAFIILAVLTMTVGNVTALRQTDVKRLMAYSSIAQAGYILAAVGAATELSRPAVLYYVMAYTFMNVGAFAVITALQVQGEGREVRDFAGLARREPLLAALLVVFLVSLVGLPPTAGFMAKFSVFRALVSAGNFWLPVVVALNSVISVGYYYNLVRYMYVVPADKEPVPSTPVAVPAPVWTVLVVCAFFTLVLGLWPDAFVRWAEVSLMAMGGAGF
ncbi:proton-translocating NADH-quinone oxidoreductase, chain N [Thermaerobacter marianensis DSM 12885]|uniref:NADH-quinone oxidoreductase subunit N n=1 Tax=Thermaerobacter marianensis (strain ATCC 700841 / DSM 12885 / JCM 10246 / 7p75a) TaxID=644966 RepID=E6SMI2_THEM7|nr:NADH-quinone oxidoreductase subunit N [Thermaerobacter marianensis]ADU50442.1 proton-translocating NADH-quinone oxidoreductase, chain N [Thermaerobacter marianensis DSM 12885]